MKLNKTILTSVAALTMLSAGAALVDSQSQTTIVEAKTAKKKLTHNAAVYNSKGKRIKKAKVLKKGSSVKVLGYKTIKGKKYARIGKNKYVKMSNFKTVTKKAKKSAVSKKTTKKNNTTKKTETKPKSNDPMINKYQSWLDDRDNGALVAIRDTHFKAMYNYGNQSTLIPKGTIIEIPDYDEEEDDSSVSVFKDDKDGKYYIEMAGPDDVVDYPAADFTFNAYKKTPEYKSLVKKYVYNGDKYDGAKVTASVPVNYYGVIDPDQAYDAGEKFTIEEPSIVLNEKGGYSLIGEDHDGYNVEIPVDKITSYKLIRDDDE